MPTRLSGWVMGALLILMTLVAGDGLVPALVAAAAFVLFGEAVYWAMRLAAPRPAPAWVWRTTGPVLLTSILGTKFAVALLVSVLTTGRPPPAEDVMLAGVPWLGLGVAWSISDIGGMLLWRMAGGPAPMRFTAAYLAFVLVLTAVAAGAMAALLGDPGFGSGLVGAAAGLGFVILLMGTVFVDLPRAADVRRAREDAAFEAAVRRAALMRPPAKPGHHAAGPLLLPCAVARLLRRGGRGPDDP